MSEPTAADVEVDVVVVGGGGAGLAAAVTAAEEGASVLLFESETELGGSTQLSAGLFTAAATSVQRGLGIEDTAERFYRSYPRECSGLQTGDEPAPILLPGCQAGRCCCSTYSRNTLNGAPSTDPEVGTRPEVAAPQVPAHMCAVLLADPAGADPLETVDQFRSPRTPRACSPRSASASGP